VFIAPRLGRLVQRQGYLCHRATHGEKLGDIALRGLKRDVTDKHSVLLLGSVRLSAGLQSARVCGNALQQLRTAALGGVGGNLDAVLALRCPESDHTVRVNAHRLVGQNPHLLYLLYLLSVLVLLTLRMLLVSTTCGEQNIGAVCRTQV
jgi:hypothetical protein